MNKYKVSGKILDKNIKSNNINKKSLIINNFVYQRH